MCVVVTVFRTRAVGPSSDRRGRRRGRSPRRRKRRRRTALEAVPLFLENGSVRSEEAGGRCGTRPDDVQAAPPDAEADCCSQKDAVRLPQVRIVWVMVAVVIAALDFGAIRALLDPRMNGPGRPPGILLLLGALPMANVLAVGVLIGQRRPGSRPFLLGFETFGAMALAVFVALAICFAREVVIPYMAPFLYPVETIIGPGRPVLYIPICGFVVLVVLGLPQLVFALIGGSLSRRFKITITPR
jgi:hypothetical protein